MNKQEDINELFRKYVHGRCTAEEIFFLLKYFDIDQNEVLLKELIRKELNSDVYEASIEASPGQMDRLYHKIVQVIDERESQRRHWRSRLHTFIRVAAVLLLMSAVAFIVYMYQTNWSIAFNSNTVATMGDKVQILTKKNDVILTLYSGKQIVLNALKQGETVQELGMIISKLDEDRVVYKIDVDKPVSQYNEIAPKNTITVPRGRKLEVILADGTKVWLNSASIFTFSPVFPEKERRVEISGEAYFEVAPDKTKPFRVKTPQYEVEVLGTHFNVMAYPEEQISQTTLLEGQVKIRNDGEEVLLEPGEQAETWSGGKGVTVRTANIEKIMAWKNGVFIFDGEKLEQIMQQVARWYDVDVIYEEEIPSIVLAGMVSREDSLERLLGILEKAGKVNFAIEGNKIIVRQFKSK
ncbi:DUF4974 domain-containing protein [Sphingobacterium sp. SGG-5]|uniref:FecR family protein n=1 Tax=Sphingobacterium sp. SGG-5 TaxID=2710881 RepID=UPI0013EAB37A|nr:FecR domain-containing protein [Sphingobacterium sp. SGG-5]NGM62785.1 DUF4974 domain-containing protein [Sphingobacterium sp. SGG-5]